MNKIQFFKESVKNLKTVGTITRSSKYLCQAMIKHVDFDNAKVIVELGAGDGVITEHILAAMKPDAKLLSFEVNKAFCDKIREINDPRLIVVEDSAENIESHLNKAGETEIDFVVSAIPFVSLPDELGYNIITKCRNLLKDGGLFIQVHYTMLAKKLYTEVFGNIDINFAPINIPPAFVFVCKKK